MSTLPELRSTSTGELQSRIPALRRTAEGPTTGGAASSAASELRRIEKVLSERAEAEERAATARATAAEAWARVSTLEEELADARATARASDLEAASALRASLGG